MANNTTMVVCPLPFLSQMNNSATEGYIDGRFCTDDCCLPCPLEDLVYSDAFPSNIKIAQWLSVVSLIFSVFLLITFAVLPAEKSHRHYLSVGLTVSNIVLELAFIVPLGSKPNMCYDEITPNDMHSSLSCAFSGAMILWGGMGTVSWVLARSLWTHLRVCWDVTHSRLFLILSHVIEWGAPTIFLAVCLRVTGVSFRLTNICFPNHPHSFADFFGWIISFAGLAFALQVATSGYCFWIYLLNLWKASTPAASASRTTNAFEAAKELPTSANPHKPWTVPRQQAWSRVKKVLVLQWRSVTLCVAMIAIVALLAGVFVSLNDSLARDKTRGFHAKEIAGWGTCLVITRDKNACLPLAKQLEITETSITASMIITSLVGVISFGLLIRKSALVGWWELIRHGRRDRRDSEDFFMVSPRRITFEQTLASELAAKDTKPTPVESTVSAFFPGRAAAGARDPNLRNSMTSSEISSMNHQNSGTDISSRASRFIEQPDEFEEKQTREMNRDKGREGSRASDTRKGHDIGAIEGV